MSTTLMSSVNMEASAGTLLKEAIGPRRPGYYEACTGIATVGHIDTMPWQGLRPCITNTIPVHSAKQVSKTKD